MGESSGIGKAGGEVPKDWLDKKGIEWNILDRVVVRK